MSDLLAHLAELDERRLYLELGFSSLFAYCTEALGFCKSAAGRRIAVARVCRKYPEAFARVARGELQLSVLSLLAQHLTSENSAELFDACSRKTCEQVEELLVAHFPKPDVRDSIRRLPARAEVAPNGGSAGYAARLAGMSAQSSSPRVAAPPAPSRATPAMPAQRKLEPLSPDRFGVHFTADAEFRELLEEVRALASHREPDGNLLSVMKRGLEAYRRELQKKRFGVGRKPRRVREAVGKSKSPTRSRHVPVAVSREVYLRDDGRCTFCSKDGRRCGARRFLQLDHVTPWAAEGQSSVENLRLRCRAHNLHAARLYFGADFIRKKQGRAAATESAAVLSSASRGGVQREASSALESPPEG
jgi:5-methylcytosine-specific restriction endonuclease McrA